MNVLVAMGVVVLFADLESMHVHVAAIEAKLILPGQLVVLVLTIIVMHQETRALTLLLVVQHKAFQQHQVTVTVTHKKFIKAWLLRFQEVQHKACANVGFAAANGAYHTDLVDRVQ